ncbi:MAG: hypothetical protein WC483_06060 [Candidatus Paceibacterota bacterium]
METLVDMGVLKGDASIEVTYDKVKVQGSEAETLVDYVKNMKASAAFTLYQINLTNLQELLDGIASVSATADDPVADHQQFIASGAWEYQGFIPFEGQNSSGAVPTNITVSGSEDGPLVADTDFFVMKNENGIWGLYVINSETVTTESQVLTLEYDYTPAASYTLKMGAASDELTAKIVEFSKTISSKVFRARLWSATNENGFSLAFPDSAGDEPASMPMTLTGGLDTTRTSGEQLIEIYDEIGLSL